MIGVWSLRSLFVLFYYSLALTFYSCSPSFGFSYSRISMIEFKYFWNNNIFLQNTDVISLIQRLSNGFIFVNILFVVDAVLVVIFIIICPWFCKVASNCINYEKKKAETKNCYDNNEDDLRGCFIWDDYLSFLNKFYQRI